MLGATGGRRRALAVKNPHLTGVVPRQEMFQGIPSAAHSHHHVSPLEKSDEDVTSRDVIATFADFAHFQFGAFS